VAALDGAAGTSAGTGASGASGAAEGVSQTAFQILPQGTPGLLEYTIEIDGQVLRYRNTAPVWTSFVWPNPNGSPGVRITGVAHSGRTVEIFNEPGRFGLTRMFEAAARKKLPGGVNELSWTRGTDTVTLQLRIISQPGAAPAQGTNTAPVASSGLRGLRLPSLVAGSDAPMPATSASSAPAAVSVPRSSSTEAARAASR
jgi:type VI secretion system protein ImpL